MVRNLFGHLGRLPLWPLALMLGVGVPLGCAAGLYAIFMVTAMQPPAPLLPGLDPIYYD